MNSFLACQIDRNIRLLLALEKAAAAGSAESLSLRLCGFYPRNSRKAIDNIGDRYLKRPQDQKTAPYATGLYRKFMILKEH